MRRVWLHMRALWPRWTLVPPLPFVAYALFTSWRGTARLEHLLLVLTVVGLAYGSRASRKLCVAAYPMALVALLYDAMKPLRNAGLSAERVHLCDLRAAEIRWFGIDAGGGRVTAQDWFQRHASPTADVLCAIPYGVYIFAAIAFALYLYARDFSAMQRFAWAFFALNVLGFVTYHLYPAAPPWYFHEHGCAVDLGASPSPGAPLVRVDAALGFHYFAGLYGRSSDVFGAMPSLHVGYPLLIVLGGWRALGWAGRSLAILFLGAMCFAAVYLDHHWILDVVVGLVYASVVFAAIALLRSEPRESLVPTTTPRTA